MRRSGRGRSVPFSFTVVELLMVVAIIAALAGLSLPALSRAKEKSRSTICKSNLRQLGIALRTYLDDFAGTYPYSDNFPVASSRGVSYWFDALGAMVPSAKWGEGIFKCPTYQGAVCEGEAKRNDRGELTAMYAPCGSYAYNAAGRRDHAFAATPLISSGLGFSIYCGQPLGEPVRETDIRAPADLYALGDAPLSSARWGTNSTMSLGGAADYNAFVAVNATIRKAQHTVVFNMLFADMHTESVGTNVLLNTNAAYRSRWNHDNRP